MGYHGENGGWVRVADLCKYMCTLEREWARDADGTLEAAYARREERCVLDWQDVCAAQTGAVEVSEAMEEIRQWLAVNRVDAVALGIPGPGLRRSEK